MPARTAGTSIGPSPSAPVHAEAGCAAATSPAGSQRVRPMKEIATMPLHQRDTVREQMEDCVFAGHDLPRPVPKYRFPRDETLPRDVFQLVSDEVMLDGNARSTWPRSARPGRSPNPRR